MLTCKPRASHAVLGAALLLVALFWSISLFDDDVHRIRLMKHDSKKFAKIEELTYEPRVLSKPRPTVTRHWFFGETGEEKPVVTGIPEDLWWQGSDAEAINAAEEEAPPQEDGKEEIGRVVDGEGTRDSAEAGVEKELGRVAGELAAKKAGYAAALEEYLSPKGAAEVAAASSPATAPQASSLNMTHGADDTLILYAFSSSQWALPNLRFFLQHALHANAHFVFLLNGMLPESPAGDVDPIASESPTDTGLDPVMLEAWALIQPYVDVHSNVEVVNRTNTCFDLGAYNEVLRADELARLKQYQRFILLNASLRGPFIPFWSRECWSEAYLRPIGQIDDSGREDGNDDQEESTPGTEARKEIKLVGMTMNCVSHVPKHVQSMIMATDRLGMGLLMGLNGTGNVEVADEAKDGEGKKVEEQESNDKSTTEAKESERELNEAPETTDVAEKKENTKEDEKMEGDEKKEQGEDDKSTQSPAEKSKRDSLSPSHSPLPYTHIGIDACPAYMQEAVDVETSLTQLVLAHNYSVTTMMALSRSTSHFERDCTTGDVNAYAGAYAGANLHPFDTMFIKSRWGVDAGALESLTRWFDADVQRKRKVGGPRAGGAWDVC